MELFGLDETKAKLDCDDINLPDRYIFNKLKVLSNKINKNLGQTIYYIIEKIENNYIIEFSEYKSIYQFEQEPNASNYVLDIVEYFDDLREFCQKSH